MPMRDHFRPPLDDLASWDGFHGGWPMKMVEWLNRQLPHRFMAAPHVHLGASVEVDVAAFEGGGGGPSGFGGGEDPGGVAIATATVAATATATSTWAPPRPSLAVSAEFSEADEYEVLVYDARRRRRLVAAVELVSPSNKDRPEHRRAFATKCAAMLQQGVCVAIVDLVTNRSANLYGEVLGLIGLADPSLGDEPPPTYAASCRWIREEGGRRLESWSHALEAGRELPTLPLWVSRDLAVPLELEGSYEETCRVLRIAEAGAGPAPG